MYRILVPVDMDETHTDEVVNVFESLPLDHSAVEVVVLNVFADIDVTDDIGGDVDTEDFYEDVEFPDSVLDVVDALGEHGFSVTAERGLGDPEDVIVSYASEGDVDHIVMAGQRRSPVGKAIFGSVTQSVILNAGIPVTVSVAD